MNHCSKVCCGLWPFILIPLILLLLSISISWKSIERAVAENANQALNHKEFTWAVAENKNNGRDIRLHGYANSESDKNKAIAIVESARGVRTVDWQGSILELERETSQGIQASAPVIKPAKLSILKNGQLVTIEGTSGTTLTETIAPEIERSNYQQNLEFEPVKSLNELLEFIATLPETLTLTINSREMYVLGTVEALGKSRLYEFQLNGIFDGTVINELRVELPDIAEEELITNAQCQVLFDELSASDTVNFEVSKATVLPDSYALLDKFTALSLRCPTANFQVIGHTDNTGDPEFNRIISLERAEKVIEHIVNSGVAQQRFVAMGLGDTQPIANNETDTGRAKNRRVEFKVFDFSSQTDTEKLN